jgi:hypothetical protein
MFILSPFSLSGFPGSGRDVKWGEEDIIKGSTTSPDPLAEYVTMQAEAHRTSASGHV